MSLNTVQPQESSNLNPLTAEINRRSGQNIELCYHCHKCTAGCPVSSAMDYGPDRVLRMAALDQLEPLVSSRDIWLCTGCYTCATRCPNDIDISAVMDALRSLALERHVKVGERDALLFHQLFMGAVKQLGRSHEAITLGLFKVLSHTPFQNDLVAGAGLFLRGKVPLLPERSGARKEVRRIFSAVLDDEAKSSEKRSA